MINQIDLPLKIRVYIDELIDRANAFALNKTHQEKAYCCYISYEWHNLSPYGAHQAVILKYIVKESNFIIDIQRCANAIKDHSDGIKLCYDTLN